MAVECRVRGEAGAPQRRRSKLPGCRSLNLQAGLGGGCDPALEYLMRRQVEEGAAATCWWPPGLGLRLGVGGSCSLKFRRGADASVLAAVIVRIRVRDAQKDAHPALCRASWKDGGPHKLERLPLDFKLVRESDAVVNPATEGPTGSPWKVMSPFSVQGQPIQVKKCHIHMNAFMKS